MSMKMDTRKFKKDREQKKKHVSTIGRTLKLALVERDCALDMHNVVNDAITMTDEARDAAGVVALTTAERDMLLNYKLAFVDAVKSLTSGIRNWKLPERVEQVEN